MEDPRRSPRKRNAIMQAAEAAFLENGYLGTNMDQIATIIRERPADFSVMAGDDSWTLAVLAMGGDGVICTCSNEIPAQMAELCHAAFAGDWEQAQRLHNQWLPLMKANFVGGPNPVPLKAAMSMMWHSGMLGSSIATVSPCLTPRAAMPAASPRTRSSSCFQVSESSSSFVRSAVRSGCWATSR